MAAVNPTEKKKMKNKKSWIYSIFNKNKNVVESEPIINKETELIINKEPEPILKDDEEKVLVFRSDLLKEDNFHGIVMGAECLRIKNKILDPKNLFYMNRSQAETRPSYKQVIPYCIFTKHDQIFVYQRSSKGSENRLHDLWSVGVGGHINPCDGNDSETLGNACKRELEEEVNFKNISSLKFIGLINDNSTVVNSVHFGVVYHINLSENSSFDVIDKALINGRFKQIQATLIQDCNWEDWSIFVIRNYLRK